MRRVSPGQQIKGALGTEPIYHFFPKEVPAHQHTFSHMNASSPGV